MGVITDALTGGEGLGESALGDGRGEDDDAALEGERRDGGQLGLEANVRPAVRFLLLKDRLELGVGMRDTRFFFFWELPLDDGSTDRGDTRGSGISREGLVSRPDCLRC